MSKLENFISKISNLGSNDLKTYLDTNNIYIALITLVSISMYNSNLKSLSGLLSHPISLLIIIGYIIQSFKENNIGMAIALTFLLIISIYSKQENDLKNKLPIVDTEHFENKEENFISNDDSDDEKSNDSDDGRKEVEVNNDDIKEDATDDSDDSEDIQENYVGKKQSVNLNDTFKNLHDAIHELENFINKSDENKHEHHNH